MHNEMCFSSEHGQPSGLYLLKKPQMEVEFTQHTWQHHSFNTLTRRAANFLFAMTKLRV